MFLEQTKLGGLACHTPPQGERSIPVGRCCMTLEKATELATDQAGKVHVIATFRRCVLGAVSLASVLVPDPVARSCFAETGRPNVLMIVVDDLNDWVGCLGGNPDARTPNIDRLAKRGLLFTRSYCAAPVCNPSRTALLTGIRPSTSGVYYNSQPWRAALPKAVTLSQHFMANGYDVGGCGKIFHGAFPEDASWQEYRHRGRDPQPTRDVADSPHSHAGGIVWGELDVDDAAMDDHKEVDWAIDYLKRSHERPFFLACGIFRPH